MLEIENWRLLDLTVDFKGNIIYPVSLQNKNLFESCENPLSIKTTLADSSLQGTSTKINVNGIQLKYILFWEIGKTNIKILAIHEPVSYSEAFERTRLYTSDKKIFQINMKIDSFDKKLYLTKSDSDFTQSYNILDIISSKKNVLGLDFAGRNSAVNFFSDLLNMRNPNPIIFKSKLYKNTIHLFLLSAKKKPNSTDYYGECCIIDEFLDNYKQFFHNNIYHELPKIIYHPTFVGFINNYLRIDSNQGILAILDIDNFSIVNSKYTFKQSNKILEIISNTLSSFIENIGSIANLREDKYEIFIPNLRTDVEINDVLNKILELVRSVKIKDLPNESFTATIGVAVFPKCGTDCETLLNKAKNALFAGKFYGKNRYAIYNSSVDKYNLTTLPQRNYLSFYKDFFHELLVEDNINKAVDHVLDLNLNFFNLSRIMFATKTMNNIYVYSKFSDINHAAGIKNFTFENVYPFIEKLKPIEYIDTKIIQSDFSKFLKSKLNFSKGYVIRFFEESEFFGIFFIESNKFDSKEKDEYLNLLYSTTKAICDYIYNKDKHIKKNLSNTRDPLTSLLNLTGFNLVASDMIKKNKLHYSLISFDIKNFSFINDFYGYTIGNKVIQFIALSLQKLIGKDEEICHINADHFLLLVNCNSEREILTRKTVIFEDIKYFKNNNLTIHLHYSIGAYIIQNNEDLHRSIDYANKARLSTKVRDYTTLNFYTKKYHEKELINKKIESLAELAIKNKEFYAVYQPCFDAKTKRIVSGEALVRWKHGDKIFYPDQFIPYLEKTGLIINMDFIIYEEVCKALKKWKEENVKLIPISVNVSRSHLLTGNFVERLEKLVKKYQIDRKYLCLEITESMLVSGQQGYAIMSELHDMGYNIYLDDFGTAYSNLKALSTINFDVIKIDKSLVDDICTTNKALTIFKSVIGMSKALGLRILVEGIETDNQLSVAIEQKCDIIQGYIFSKPIDFKEFDKKVRYQSFVSSENDEQ